MSRRGLLPSLCDGDPGLSVKCPKCGAWATWDGWATPDADPNIHQYRCPGGHVSHWHLVFDADAFASNRLRRAKGEKP